MKENAEDQHIPSDGNITVLPLEREKWDVLKTGIFMKYSISLTFRPMHGNHIIFQGIIHRKTLVCMPAKNNNCNLGMYGGKKAKQKSLNTQSKI